MHLSLTMNSSLACVLPIQLCIYQTIVVNHLFNCIVSYGSNAALSWLRQLHLPRRLMPTRSSSSRSGLATSTLMTSVSRSKRNSWDTSSAQLRYMILQDYIAIKDSRAVYVPHTAGRYAVRRFRKAQVLIQMFRYMCDCKIRYYQCPIVERVVNALMMHGRNNGKKLLTVRIIKHSFEIINLLTGEVCSLRYDLIN